jgi:hypothetical protein
MEVWDFSAYQVGNLRFVWGKREYGVSGLWVKRASTVCLFFQVAKTFILNALMTCIQAPMSSEQMNIFDNLMDITSTPLSDDELQCYLAADIKDVKDGLMWWHEQHSIFPQLSRMARDYLSIPGECLFSCICLMY